jgi:uncharacterized membrane protein YdcZ (DUF606 family)
MPVFSRLCQCFCGFRRYFSHSVYRRTEVFILLIAGQILMAIAVSQFGILEPAKDPINMKKMIGAILVLTGVIFYTY